MPASLHSMSILPAAAKASAKIVPTTALIVLAAREVSASPVTMQTVATAFAGVCGLWLVGAVVSSRDATKELKDTINHPEHGILARIHVMAEMVQAHEGELGKRPKPRRRKALND